jgi:hypothetical protein
MAFERIWGRGSLLALAVVCFAVGAAPARADNVTLPDTDFSCVGPACAQQSTHEDADPFKGSITLTVTNTGTEAWGDFHFEFFSTGYSIDNVDWVITSPYEPTKDGSTAGLTAVVDNVVVGATLDLFFYGNPVQPNDSVTFVVYSDNTTDQVPFFGTSYYPTPVPEPATALSLALGLVALAMHARRRRA